LVSRLSVGQFLSDCAV